MADGDSDEEVDFDAFKSTVIDGDIDGTDTRGSSEKISDERLIEIALEVLDGSVFRQTSLKDHIPYKIPLDEDDNIKNMPSTMVERLKKNGYKLTYETKILGDGETRALEFNVIELDEEQVEEFRKKKDRWRSDKKRIVSTTDEDIRRSYCDECGKLISFGVLNNGGVPSPVLYCKCGVLKSIDGYDIEKYDGNFPFYQLR